MAITIMLQVTNSHSTSRLQTTDKGIQTLFRRLIGIGIPPVGNRNFCEAGRYCKSLPDAIGTTYISTEVDTILATMQVRAINHLITARR